MINAVKLYEIDFVVHPLETSLKTFSSGKIILQCAAKNSDMEGVIEVTGDHIHKESHANNSFSLYTDASQASGQVDCLNNENNSIWKWNVTFVGMLVIDLFKLKCLKSFP